MATLVVADDNADNLELMLLILSAAGYQVHMAHDGAEAVEAVLEHSPDAVIMDIYMPNLDGLTATKRLRALPTSAGVPVIAFTAYPAALGADAHLFTRVCLKPISPTELMNVIEEVLGTRGLRGLSPEAEFEG